MHRRHTPHTHTQICGERQTDTQEIHTHRHAYLRRDPQIPGDTHTLKIHTHTPGERGTKTPKRHEHTHSPPLSPFVEIHNKYIEIHFTLGKDRHTCRTGERETQTPRRQTLMYTHTHLWKETSRDIYTLEESQIYTQTWRDNHTHTQV